MKEKEIEQYNRELTGRSPEEVLEFFLEKYRSRIVQATSMSPEDQVITRMIATIDRNTRIVTLDTGRLPRETYDLVERTNEKYRVSIELLFPDYRQVEQMTREHGINLFYRSVELRKMCCRVRKDESIKRVLKDQDAWICGIRKDQTVTRFFNRMVEWDSWHKLIKVNPLLNWTDDRVWDYIKTHDVPVNKLHEQGYGSIGCAPCTRPLQPGEDKRAGRWWWEQSEHKECGLHNRDLKGDSS